MNVNSQRSQRPHAGMHSCTHACAHTHIHTHTHTQTHTRTTRTYTGLHFFHSMSFIAIFVRPIFFCFFLSPIFRIRTETLPACLAKFWRMYTLDFRSCCEWPRGTIKHFVFWKSLPLEEVLLFGFINSSVLEIQWQSWRYSGNLLSPAWMMK